MPGDGAGPQSIQSRVVEALQPAWVARVGIDVDDAHLGASALGLDGVLDATVLQPRLALAALAVADDGRFLLLQVGYGHLDDFLGGGNERLAVLGREEELVFLF